MKRRLMLTALLVLTLTLSVFPTPANSDPATRYVAPSSMGGDDTNPGTEGSPWRTIQHAVSNSNSGDIIKLMDDDNDGTKDYPEIYQVEVTKQLTIERYDDDATKPWVYQQVHYDHVFYISADHVTISGLKLAGATEPSQAGIYVGHSAYCTFNDNDVTDNYYGIYLYSSDHCNINDNNVSYNNSTEGAGDSQGIRLYKSSENTISGNTVNYNGHNGIELTGTSSEPSTNNTLNNNTVNNNGSMGIVLSGGSSSPNNTINNNTANSNDYDGIYIAYGSDNSNVINNTTSYNGRYGIGISVVTP
ncbi:MAG: right-handed parallel beta-helix repeat-containing protein [Anaerolineales bacterium]|nr:right-handed parallel beta-helix repeat-containing protein [Anaerolineales bacterium]